jgi:hypothetical protein
MWSRNRSRSDFRCELLTEQNSSLSLVAEVRAVASLAPAVELLIDA